MRIEIEIPKEFEADYTADKFADFLGRVRADIDYNGMCGNYERETADVLAEAFKNSRVIQSVAHEGGRLIDAEKLIDFIKDDDCPCMLQTALINIIKAQRTTYDVDKVMEQLKNYSYTETQDDMNPFEPVKVVTLEDAIEIVKAGGIDEVD